MIPGGLKFKKLKQVRRTDLHDIPTSSLAAMPVTASRYRGPESGRRDPFSEQGRASRAPGSEDMANGTS